MKITKIREVKTPTRGTECSAGLDFYVPAGMKLSMLPGDDVLIPSGIKVEVPHGYALIAHNRSSMATSTRALKYAGLKGNPNSTRGCVVVGACVVDEDYQGEIGGWIENEDNLSHCGDCWVYGDAEVEKKSDYIVFKNWWSSGRYFTWTRSNDKWRVGCFYGTGEELIKKAYNDSDEKGREYERIVKYVESIK
jgi:dUTPase